MFWQDQQGQKAPLQAPARPASDMWDRDGVLNKGVEDDAENPALSRKRRGGSSGGGADGATTAGGAGAAGQSHDDDDGPSPRCDFYKKGWFWACVIVVTIVCVAAPVGVYTQRKIDREGMNPKALTPKSASGTYDKWAAGGGRAGAGGANALLFDPVSGTFSAGNGNRTVDVAKLTCADLRADIPLTATPEGKPPPALLSAADLKPASLPGLTWPGFDDGASTFLSGLSTGEGWASGDLASAAYSLRAAGARAVRVPFAFTDLFTIPPRAAAHRCGAPAPGAIELAETAKAAPRDAEAASLVRPVAAGTNAAAFCNAYVPAASLGGASSTLTRLLYTTQTLVESGLYVVLAYAPPTGAGGEAVVEAPESLAASWGRLWAALSCLPGYEERLAGRVLAEPLATPKSHGIAWGGGGGKGSNGTAAAAAAPLGEYYAAAADAIEARVSESGGQAPVYVLAGAPGQAASFAGSKPAYAKRVVSAADLYSGAAAKAAAWREGTDLPGARPWTADAAEVAAAAKAKGAKRDAENDADGWTVGDAGSGQPAPGTVAAARAAARAAAEAGVVEIETGRRR